MISEIICLFFNSVSKRFIKEELSFADKIIILFSNCSFLLIELFSVSGILLLSLLSLLSLFSLLSLLSLFLLLLLLLFLLSFVAFDSLFSDFFPFFFSFIKYLAFGILFLKSSNLEILFLLVI